MKKAKHSFIVRWFVCSFGLWLAAGFLDGRITYGGKTFAIVISGLVLALINTVIKPIIIFFSLPAILVSLGLFMIVVNGLTVMLASIVYKPLEVTGLGAAMIAGVIIGLVNLLVSAALEE